MTVHLNSQQCLLPTLSGELSFLCDVLFPTHFNFPTFFSLGRIDKCSSHYFTALNRYSHLHFHHKAVISYHMDNLCLPSACVAVCVPLWLVFELSHWMSWQIWLKAFSRLWGKDHKGLWGILVRNRLTFEFKVYPGGPVTGNHTNSQFPLGLLLWELSG